MSKYTPGKWYVYTGEDGEAVAVAEWRTGLHGGVYGADVAKMPLPSKKWTREQIDANAALIAAAPETAAERGCLREVNAELLEALKIALGQLTEDSHAQGRLEAAGWVEAAIAKAEGRS